MAEVTPCYRERVVRPGDGGGLVGVLTTPAAPHGRVPFVLLVNAGIIPHVGPHRAYVQFARALASESYPVLRFDLSGIGDSERRGSGVSLQESVRRDIAAALDHLAAHHGAERFVVAGLCSGAFDAFEYAQLDSRVAGACMIDMPGSFRNWSHFAIRAASRALSPAAWANLGRRFAERTVARGGHAPGRAARGGVPSRALPVVTPGVRMQMPRAQLETGLDALLARGVRLAFLFTGGVEDQYNHRLQFRLRFPRAAAHPFLSTDFIPWSDHTFSTRASRDYVTRFLREWLTTQFPVG